MIIYFDHVNNLYDSMLERINDKYNNGGDNEKKKYKLEIPKGNVNIYDWDINYGGKEVIANKDSISLINTSAFYNDSIVTKE